MARDGPDFAVDAFSNFALDQESPGSSPGGAMPTVNNRGPLLVSSYGGLRGGGWPVATELGPLA